MWDDVRSRGGIFVFVRITYVAFVLVSLGIIGIAVLVAMVVTVGPEEGLVLVFDEVRNEERASWFEEEGEFSGCFCKRGEMVVRQ